MERVAGLDKVRECLSDVTDKYRAALGALGEMDDALAKVLVGETPVRADVEQRIHDTRAVIREEANAAREVPELLLGLGIGRPGQRWVLGERTRLGLRPAAAKVHDAAVEEMMVELEFSHSQIGLLIEGPRLSKKARARRVSDRMRKRRQKSAPES